jgi:hypothetical protein
MVESEGILMVYFRGDDANTRQVGAPPCCGKDNLSSWRSVESAVSLVSVRGFVETGMPNAAHRVAALEARAGADWENKAL